jgi:hypothetical protein
MGGCPCKEGRYGAFALVVSWYWAYQVGGFAAMLHLVGGGTALGVWWAIWTGLGVVLLMQGVREALSHDDQTDGGSVLVSVGLIGLALWALANHWFIPGNDWISHASRVLPFGLLGSECFNLWLNFRGRRHAAPEPEPVVETQPARFALRRSRHVEVTDEFEGLGIDAEDLARLLANHLGQNTPTPAHGSSSIEGNGARPQIVYVPNKQGQLIPVVLPSREKVRQ